MKTRHLISLSIILFISSCASPTYQKGLGKHGQNSSKLLATQKQQVERGKPNKLLDASDWYTPNSLLSKLFLWNKKVDSHQIGSQTEEQLITYLKENDLRDVKLLINRYDPKNQWKRLVRNDKVSPLYRYTFGLVANIGYTILPGRLFGGDHYNPYTNTINLYSDIPAIALHEGAHAKDTNSRKYPGTHAAIYALGSPYTPLYYEHKATEDALSYLHDKEDKEGLKKAYKILHPAYGTYVSPYGGVIIGHITGAIKAKKVK